MTVSMRVWAGLVALIAAMGMLTANPAAHAYGPAPSSLNCAVYLNGSDTIYSTTVWTDSFSLTQVPSSPMAGQTVTVTFMADGGPTAPVTVYAATLSLEAVVRVSGATTATVALNDGPSDTYPTATYAAGDPLGAISLSGTYTAASSGEGQLSLEQFLFDEARDSPLVYAPDEDVFCSGGAAGTDHKTAPVPSSVITETYGAGPIAASLWCRYYFDDALPGNAYPSQYAPYVESFQLAQSPASPRPGDVVSVSLSATNGPYYGPLPANPGEASPVATFVLSGAMSQTITLDDGPTDTYPSTAVPSLQRWGPYTVLGSYVASGSGTATMALRQLEFDAGRDHAALGGYVGANVDVYCSDSGGDRDHKSSPVTSSTIARTFAIGPSAEVVSIVGQAAGVTGYVRQGNLVSVSGDLWTASLSSAAFTVSVGGLPAASTLATDATRGLSGSFTVPSGVPSGQSTVLITASGETASIPVTVLGSPALSLDRSTASPGTTLRLSGSNFNPSSPHYVYASKPNTYTNRSPAIPAFNGATCPAAERTTIALLAPAAPDDYLAGVGPFIPADAVGSGAVGSLGDFSSGTRDCGTAQVVMSSSSGTIEATLTALDGQTGVLVTETLPGSTFPANVVGTPVNGRVALVAFAPNQSSCTRQVGSEAATACQTAQDVAATVNPGALTQTAGDYDGAGLANTSTSIDLGSVTTSNVAQVLGGHLNPVTVADARGGQATWSLTAAMPDLTDGSTGSISRANVALSGVACTANIAGSATGNIAGVGGSFANTLTLCVKNGTADSSGQTTGGRYVVNADLALTVPQFQKAAAYSSTITVTLT